LDPPTSIVHDGQPTGKKKKDSPKPPYLFGIVTTVSIRLHVPDDLMTEELRDLGSLEDETLSVA